MKKIRIVLAVLILCSISAVFTGCKKGEEDPFVSLRSRKARLVGEWDMDRAFKNGVQQEVINENPQIGEVTEDWVFYEDGRVLTEDGNSTITGTWEFADKKEAIVVTLHGTSAGASIQTYELVRLAHKEMVWEHTIGSDKFRYELSFSSEDY